MDSLLKKLDKATKKVKLSQEEIGQAILLLSTEDVKQRFHIGNVILQQGLKSLPKLTLAMDLDKPEIRRTVVYILGKLSKQLIAIGQPVPQEAMDALYRGLLDEDPKVRRNSAVALGDLKISVSAGNVIHALSRETTPWVRTSMILALGSIGGDETVAYLSSYQADNTPERIALEKALDRSASIKSNWRFIKKLTNAIPMELWTAEGMERVVAEGVKKELSLAVGQVTPGRVCISTADAYGLFALRTFTELLIPLAKAQLNSPDEIKAVVAENLRQENILEKILALHEDDQQVMRYRLEIKGKGLRHNIRRTIIREIAEAITAACPVFVNSPSHYDLEIRILLEEKTAEFLLKPFTIPDNRFSYRIKDVPASINPAVAAGVIRLAPRLFPQGRVLDPFCGSGTMLIERGFAVGHKELVGVDISPAAIEAAKQNVCTAGFSNMTLINDDMRNISRKEKFHEIITNMPFGIRTSNHETNVKLYREFFDLIPHILAEHGLVILYTQEVSLTTNLFRKSKHLKLSSAHRVTAGGLRPAIFIGTMK